jgi:hypothetical protein
MLLGRQMRAARAPKLERPGSAVRRAARVLQEPCASQLLRTRPIRPRTDPPRRWRASPRSITSRASSTGNRPRDRRASAGPPAPGRDIRALAAREARADQPEDKLAEGSAMLSLDGMACASSSTMARSRSTTMSSSGPRPLRRVRQRCGALGHHRLADRDLSADRRPSSALPHRCNHPHRQRAPAKPPRRTPTLGLCPHASHQKHGLRTKADLGLRQSSAPDARDHLRRRHP